MFKWKVKEFEVPLDCGINIHDQDEVTDWLNEKGFHEPDVKIVGIGNVLRIYYKEWLK